MDENHHSHRALGCADMLGCRSLHIPFVSIDLTTSCFATPTWDVFARLVTQPLTLKGIHESSSSFGGGGLFVAGLGIWNSFSQVVHQ